jgi:hypothetical protein
MSDQALVFLVIGAVILVVVIRAISKSQSRENEKAEKARQVDEGPGADYRLRFGAFRGERDSPGTSPEIVGKHSVNCECIFCLYGHDPDNPTGCRCKACSDPASVYGR